MFDIRSDQEVAMYYHDGIECGVTSVAFSSSGRLLFGGYDDYKVQLFDAIRAEKTGLQIVFKRRLEEAYVLYL